MTSVQSAKPIDEPYQVNLNVTLVCPECKIFPPDLVERFSEGDMVCGQCGLVLSDRIVDTRSEWRTFSNDDQGNDDPSRVGGASNPLLDGEQLDTLIAYGQKGSTLGRDLNRAQNKNMDKKDNVLQSSYSKITQMCEAYLLPKMVQDAAKDAYRNVYDDKKLKGKSQESIMAAAIFIACRQAGVARTFKEIWALTHVPKKEIGRTFKVMEKILMTSGVKLSNSLKDDYQTTQTNAEDLMLRFCSHLGLSPAVTNAAESIARKAKKEGTLAGRSPISVAAAAIYMASGLFGQALSASKIAEKTGVSDGTIKTSYKHLWEAREKFIDPEWIKSGKANMDNIPKV
ncbi:putative transcription initiation factor IIB [Nadsonia fulvescens var. elongata DSM 6958]|uniref:Transcription initiation factor IIB n=1 Tax=Nadsonia fulvescens var. elongata DSM 6958 TaxID=857566 RepID=A0A1E3PMG7_9ASCO|nr:putative transcription initiation factor IIB [Nadsonia fulvescens var. elongata DSM 6958]